MRRGRNVRKSNMHGPKGRKRGNGHNANNFAACVDADARTKKQRGGRGELSLARGKVHTSKPPPKLIQISCSNLFMWASFSGGQFTLRKCLQQSDLVKLGGTSAEEGKGYSITEEGRRRDKEGGLFLLASLRRRSPPP